MGVFLRRGHGSGIPSCEAGSFFIFVCGFGLLSFWLIQGGALRGRGQGFGTSLLRFVATVYSVFLARGGPFSGISETCLGVPGVVVLGGLLCRGHGSGIPFSEAGSLFRFVCGHGLFSFWLIQGGVLRGRGQGFGIPLFGFVATVY